MDYSSNEYWNCDAWKLLENMTHETPVQRFDFTMADMLQYFIHRKAADGLASHDFKDVNTRAFPLFKAGHIQYVYYRNHNERIFMKCNCMAEMKKGLAYKIRVVFKLPGEIEFAVCGCPAGRGPMCMCKHLAAFCYFVEEFCCAALPGRLSAPYTSSTSSLQQWHQPRKRSSSPCTLDNVKFTKAVYGKESIKVASTGYDPRPQELRVTTDKEVQHLRQSLEAMETPVALLHVLPLAPQAATPSSTESCTANQTVNLPLPHIPRSAQFRAQAALRLEPKPVSLPTLHKHMIDFTKMIMYCREDRQRIEVATRRQSKCIRWHEERHCRITSSNFGSLCKSVTTCKVKSLLYADSKSAICSSAIVWGRLHEKSAFDQYQSSVLPKEYSLREAGIYVSKYGFIAASPDGVIETSDKTVCGVIEIKCPYSCRTVPSVLEASRAKSFFCEIVDEKRVQLKRSHQYYFQVQGSMAIVGAQWCDFIVWLMNDMTVERIHFDPTFWQKCFEQLQHNYLTYILPEIIYPQVPIGQEIMQYPVSLDIIINYSRYISLESEP